MKTCLIVDDSKVVRTVASRIVDKFGFHIDEAEDGAQALTLCEKKLPDLILLDWYMPVMSGLEFLGKLRALKGGDKTKVIFCTTENNSEHIRQALSAGANEYVMKPFDAEILTAKIEQVGLL